MILPLLFVVKPLKNQVLYDYNNDVSCKNESVLVLQLSAIS